MKEALVPALALFICGCSAESTALMVGNVGPFWATPTDAVILYILPPQREHQVIARVSGSAATHYYFSRPRTENAAILAMKKEAAKLGANAVVLTYDGRNPYEETAIGSTAAPTHDYGVTDVLKSRGLVSLKPTVLGLERVSFEGTAIWLD